MTANNEFREEEIPPNYVAGQMVEVLWSENDLEGTIWQPGWYKGEIQVYDKDNDVIHIWYLEDWAVYSFDFRRCYSSSLSGYN